MEIVAQLVGHEQSERWRQVAADHLVFVNEDAFEHSLVEVSTDAWTGLAVQVLTLAQQSTYVGQPSVQELPITVEFGHAGLDLCSSKGDPLLLLLDGIHVQSASGHRLQESLLTLLQLHELASTFGHGGVTGGENLVEMLDRQ